MSSGLSGAKRAVTGPRRLGRRSAVLIALLVMLGGLVLVAGVLVVQGRTTAAVVTLGVAQLIALVGIAVQLRRLSVATSRELSRIDARVADSRARAARWEKRMAPALVSDAPASHGGSWRGHPFAADLIATGIVDADFYEVVANREFASAEEAASHFLSVGMARLSSPHPLVRVTALPEPVQSTWRGGDIDAVLAHLRGDPVTIGPLGPLFDPALLGSRATASREHPGGCLGLFLQQATDDTPLPAPGRTALWGDVRTATEDYLVSVRAGRRRRRPRVTKSWDAAAERDWRAPTSSQDVPSAGDDQPLVSVIMPSWNRETAIAGAIRSVQAQTLDAWELVVVDDGSEDATVEVVRSLAGGDGRIRLVEQSHTGLAAALNAGLGAARAEHVAFLDAEHAWDPEFLELMIKGLRREGAGAAYSAVEVRSDDSTSYRAHRGGLDDLLVRNHIDLNVLVARRSLVTEVGGFDEELRGGLAHDLAIRIARREEPVFFPFIGCRQDGSDAVASPWPDGAASPGHAPESENWQLAVLGKSLVDWDRLQQETDRNVPGRVSVVIPTLEDFAMTTGAVDSILDGPGDVEVIVVDNGSHLDVGLVLAQLWASDPRVRVVHLPTNLSFAVGSNLGVAEATGEYVFFLNNDTVAPGEGLTSLVARLQDARCLGVQPLLLYPDNSIQAAGTVFVADNHLPVHFLSGLPPEDGEVARDLRFRAVTAAALLMRRTDVLRLRGFDPRFVNGMEDVDLCLRAGEATSEGCFAVEPTVRFQHLESKTPGRGKHIDANRQLFMERWHGRLPAPELEKLAAVRLRVERIGTDGRLVPGLRPIWVRDRPGAPLRWGLRYASAGGAKGDRWGDTSYAESLAAALRRRGQEVVTYRHRANQDTTHVFDDVSLVLRGLDLVAPIPGIINILWVISHPEIVTPVEARGFDLVYSASPSWARTLARLSGRDVVPLLQATDAERFAPAEADEPFTRPAVFVGGNHSGRERQIVSDALAAGVDLRVIGSGWQDVVPPTVLEAEHVDNRELSAVYRSASRVLADHWPEMAELGFIQNRLFDAVASGARVISDDVVGLRDVFGSAVQTYDSVQELRHLCSPDGAALFGTRDEILEQAEDIRTRHSFDSRAATLLDAVESLRSTRT
ncbi:glycosyltransferase [Intrasporangium sp. DVR]|uniref:glycosyltransferase n=1 Tax=Intrasporangium sp. DVR TaxID=3127867 RepID=UPI00313A583F